MSKKQQNDVPAPTIQTLSALIKTNNKYLGECVPTSIRPTLTQDRIHKVVMAAARKNPMIIQCTPQSVMFCVAQACALGLEPGGVMDHIYLIPRFNKHSGQQECTIIVSYKGMMELARRSGQFKNIEAHVVYENDDIDVLWGTETRVMHRPCIKGPRGAIIGVHCRADFTNGGSHYEYMTLEDINHVRKSSKSGGVWDNHFGEMARKSVVRRAAKYWPQAADMMDAIMVDERSSEDDDDSAQIVDASFEEDNMQAAKAGIAMMAKELDAPQAP